MYKNGFLIFRQLALITTLCLNNSETFAQDDFMMAVKHSDSKKGTEVDYENIYWAGFKEGLFTYGTSLRQLNPGYWADVWRGAHGEEARIEFNRSSEEMYLQIAEEQEIHPVTGSLLNTFIGAPYGAIWGEGLNGEDLSGGERTIAISGTFLSVAPGGAAVKGIKGPSIRLPPTRVGRFLQRSSPNVCSVSRNPTYNYPGITQLHIDEAVKRYGPLGNAVSRSLIEGRYAVKTPLQPFYTPQQVAIDIAALKHASIPTKGQNVFYRQCGRFENCNQNLYYQNFISTTTIETAAYGTQGGTVAKILTTEGTPMTAIPNALNEHLLMPGTTLEFITIENGMPVYRANPTPKPAVLPPDLDYRTYLNQ